MKYPRCDHDKPSVEDIKPNKKIEISLISYLSIHPLMAPKESIFFINHRFYIKVFLVSLFIIVSVITFFSLINENQDHWQKLTQQISIEKEKRKLPVKINETTYFLDIYIKNNVLVNLYSIPGYNFPASAQNELYDFLKQQFNDYYCSGTIGEYVRYYSLKVKFEYIYDDQRINFIFANRDCY